MERMCNNNFAKHGLKKQEKKNKIVIVEYNKIHKMKINKI